MKPNREHYGTMLALCKRFGCTSYRGLRVVIAWKGENVLCYSTTRTPVGVR